MRTDSDRGDPKGQRTDIVLFKPGERVYTLTFGLVVLDILCAGAVDPPRWTKQLDGDFDKTGQEQDEKDDGSQDNHRRDQLTIGDEIDDQKGKQNPQRACSYPEWHVPNRSHAR